MCKGAKGQARALRDATQMTIPEMRLIMKTLSDEEAAGYRVGIEEVEAKAFAEACSPTLQLALGLEDTSMAIPGQASLFGFQPGPSPQEQLRAAARREQEARARLAWARGELSGADLFSAVQEARRA